MRYYILVILIAAAANVSAQEIFSWSKANNYCNPSVVGLPRAKAIVIKYEVLPQFSIRSTGQQGGFGNAHSTVSRNRRWDARLRFPIVNKPSITIAGGFKYTHEEFRFSPPGNRNSYPLYHDLEDRPLKSIGFHLYMVKPTKTNKYFVLRSSLDLNGDYGSEKFGKTEFLKFSVTPLLGWKKNENLTYGVGFSYGYTFGKPLLIPIVSINKNFDCNWGIESLLPINIRLRYAKNENNYWYTGFELTGASYRLDNKNDVLDSFQKLHLFRSELRYTINFERAIYDWLWFGLEGGWRHNFRFNLTNGPKGRADVIISSHLADAALINASIFVVPPKGMLGKRR